MKILHVSSNDIDGGAAVAAYRTHLGLERLGVDTRMFVSKKDSDSARVIGPRGGIEKVFAKLKPKFDSLPLRFFSQRDRNTLFSLEWMPPLFQSPLNRIPADVLNFHWICAGFQSIEAMAQETRPQVWTLHDMWAFTGGCHYSGECSGYLKECLSCPALKGPFKKGPAYWGWRRKKAALARANVSIVCPSRWLANCAKSSSLLRDKTIHLIPYGIDLERFKPLPKKAVREELGLNPDKKLVLFGAMSATSDRRKGFQYLLPAIQKLRETSLAKEVELVVFGATRPDNPPDFGIPVNYLGRVADEVSLAKIYSACDVFVAPSVQDNLPNTVIEALACGTPCVAFDIGGMPDMIDHLGNGYLARPFEPEDLAKGMEFVLGDRARHADLCQKARKKAELEYDLLKSAQQYVDLYGRILG